MKPIKQLAIMGELNDMPKFYEHVSKSIGEFQEAGLEVEIQYQFSNNVFTALIIGRG